MYSLLSTKTTTYSPGLEGLHVHWYHYTASVVFPHLTSELTSSCIIPDQPTVPFWQHNHRSNSGARGWKASGRRYHTQRTIGRPSSPMRRKLAAWSWKEKKMLLRSINMCLPR